MSGLPVQRKQRGVSLIEALVALAVMAFGMLGVIGVQATLRMNSDVAKQRSEAVRLAQLSIERARTFTKVAATAGEFDYTDILNSVTDSASYTSINTNAAYSVEQVVAPSGDSRDSEDIRTKMLRVTVNWADRNSVDNAQNQAVVMQTAIGRVMPELAGTLSLARSVGSNGVTQTGPSGRNIVIPLAASDNHDGTSNFTPPGASGVTWIFNNTTGLIKIVGDTLCGAGNCYLLSGYVRFATGSTPDGRAEMPTSAALALGVRVNQTTSVTGSALRTVDCYTSLSSDYVSYYCAIPAATTSPFAWFGRSELYGLALSSTLADATASSFKICRYTPERGVVGGVEKGDFPSTGNAAHPLDYATVRTPLINQNFLVISSGNGAGTAYDCPADDASTLYVNGNTWRHQPRT